MFLLCLGYCACCGGRVCKRCAGCHNVACADQTVVCRLAVVVHRGDPRVGIRRRSLKGVLRRLR